MDALETDGGHVLMDRAEWLAMGYVQGQRDLLLQLLEDRFTAPLPNALRSTVSQATLVELERLGPKLLSASDLAEALDGIEATTHEFGRESA